MMTTVCVRFHLASLACLLMISAAAGCTAERKIRCGAGTELIGGKCIPLTGSAADGGTGDASLLPCGDGTFASDAGCQGLRPIGAACKSGSQCSSGSCLAEDRGATDGYCTVAACNPKRPCPAGSLCTFVGADDSFVCLVYCDADDDCRDGYACQPLYTNDASVCVPSCAKTHACPSGTKCDTDSGKCLLHECKLGTSDACADKDTKDAKDADGGKAPALVCYADTLGISKSGALCLPACNPTSTETDTVCASNEVCQPLPEDPTKQGLCVPPLCMTTEDCTPGALCMDGVCQPPARCDSKGKCSDKDAICVGGAGGQCMPPCPAPAKGSCSDIHPGLSCSVAVGACLPTGAFPGSACLSDTAAPCSPLSVKVGKEFSSIPMSCEGGVCLASCAIAGDTICNAISATLACSQDAFDKPLCLPKGSFPGGPCGGGNTCDPLSHDGADIPMACAKEKCVITCDAANGGDVLCNAIDASLVCTPAAFGGSVDLCLPRGAYPGGPCAAGNTCDTGMTCQADKCLFQCTTGGEALCNGVSAGLSCASGVYSEPVCLPRGSFPGSPCRPTVGDECDQNLSGLPDADLKCVNEKCVVQCETLTIFSSGDALCGTVSPTLTCVSSPALDFCAPACGPGNTCPSGYACLTSQGACLPAGTFLGSPCAAGNTCSGSPMLTCVPGANPTCAAGCTMAGMPSAYCQALNSTFGTSFDTCTDVDPSGGTLLVCIDAP